MDNRCLIEGLKEIGAFFGDDYKPEAIKAVKDEIMPYPNEAMLAAYRRAITEFPQKFLPPIGKIRDIIVAEGKKILAKQTDDREREAEERRKEQKKHDPGIGKTHDDYGKDCMEALHVMMDPDLDEQEKLKAIVLLEKKYPGKGWRDVFNDVFKNWHRRGLIKQENMVA